MSSFNMPRRPRLYLVGKVVAFSHPHCCSCTAHELLRHDHQRVLQNEDVGNSATSSTKKEQQKEKDRLVLNREESGGASSSSLHGVEPTTTSSRELVEQFAVLGAAGDTQVAAKSPTPSRLPERRKRKAADSTTFSSRDHEGASQVVAESSTTTTNTTQNTEKLDVWLSATNRSLAARSHVDEARLWTHYVTNAQQGNQNSRSRTNRRKTSRRALTLAEGTYVREMPDAENLGCEEAARIPLPCGWCGPGYGDVEKCKEHCDDYSHCTHIVFFLDDGCRAYSSCDSPVTFGGGVGTHIYRREIASTEPPSSSEPPTSEPATSEPPTSEPATSEAPSTSDDTTADGASIGTGLVIAGAVLVLIAGIFIGMDMRADPAAAPPGRQQVVFEH